MAESLLAIRDLQVSFGLRDGGRCLPLRGVDLEVAPREVHCLVGESGSGKPLTATSVLGLLPVPPARIETGSIRFQGQELLGLPESERRRVRGRRIGMVFQEPSKYLNPSLRVGEQIVEALTLHLGLSRKQAVARAGELLHLDLTRHRSVLTRLRGGADVERIEALFKRAKLPTVAPDLGAEAYLNYMGVDKKVEGGKIRFILFRKVGECYVSADAPADLLRQTLTEATATMPM